MQYCYAALRELLSFHNWIKNPFMDSRLLFFLEKEIASSPYCFADGSFITKFHNRVELYHLEKQG